MQLAAMFTLDAGGSGLNAELVVFAVLTTTTDGVVVAVVAVVDIIDSNISIIHGFV